jgi:uncharacterized cofD-like protein
MKNIDGEFFKWFYPGLRIKRWISLLFVGIILILISAPHLWDKSFIWSLLYFFLFILGVSSLVSGIAYLIKSFYEVLYPNESSADLFEIIYKKRRLAKGPKITAIGGGTGLSTILEGLREHTSNISAIVAMSDEGGSSGRLREEFGMLPPGDIRNCLVSLSASPQLMRDLFQYRFTEGDGIKGHSFGNIFITAMTQVTGSFKAAIEESSKVLAISGRVIPSSLENIRLRAEYEDGSIRDGEDKIPEEGKAIKLISLVPSDAKSNPEAIEAIREADIIIMGPGSLFTSIIPNLLINQLREEMSKKDAIKLYICNVMTQPGETDAFTAYDHVQALVTHAGKGIVNCCLVNSGRLEYQLLLKYAKEKSFPVILDREKIRKIGIAVFEAEVVSKSNYLRHDFSKTAQAVMDIYNNNKTRWKSLKKKW